MALTQGEKAVLGVMGTAAAAFGLYYLVAGAGKEKNAALIPDSIEDQLDMTVEHLNNIFGKSWIQYAIDALQQALPAPLTALVQFVHAAELRFDWSGEQKRRYAHWLWDQAHA